MDIYQIWTTYNKQWSRYEILAFVGVLILHTISESRTYLDLCRGIVLHLCGVSLQKEKRKEKTWVDYLSYFRLIMRN